MGRLAEQKKYPLKRKIFSLVNPLMNQKKEPNFDEGNCHKSSTDRFSLEQIIEMGTD